MENIQGLIFDYDGTLADSLFLWDKVDEEYVRAHHIKTDMDIAFEVRNLSFRECADFFIREFHITDPPEVIMAEWNDMAYHAYVHDIPLKDGVKEFLEAAKAHGLPMLITTSNQEKNVIASLEKHGISHYFKDVLSADRAGWNKCDARLFQKSADILGVPPTKCVVFDDILAALCAAKAAGSKAVGVFDKRTTKEDTEKIKSVCDLYIHSFRELLEEFS